MEKIEYRTSIKVITIKEKTACSRNKESETGRILRLRDRASVREPGESRDPSVQLLADRQAVLAAGVLIGEGIGIFLHKKNTETADRALLGGSGQVGRLLAEGIVRNSAVAKSHIQSILVLIEREVYGHHADAVGVGIAGHIDEELFHDHVEFKERAHAAGNGVKKKMDLFLRRGEILRNSREGDGIRAFGCICIGRLKIAHITVPFECLSAK